MRMVRRMIAQPQFPTSPWIHLRIQKSGAARMYSHP
jgi:hypothetical protein